MTIREEQRRRVTERLAGRLLATGRHVAEAARIATDPQLRPFRVLWMEVNAAARAAA
jgi:hypothetical protein